jgi:hypothetical protein
VSKAHGRAGRRWPLAVAMLCLALLGTLAAREAIVRDAGATSSQRETSTGEKDGARDRAKDGQDAAGGSGSKDKVTRGDATSAAAAEGEGVSTRVMRGGVGPVAKKVLAGYEDSSDCVLARAGYVDLLGGAWSCTVVGGDWVDTVVVRARKDRRSCEVKTVRMDASTWEREATEL